RKLLELLVDPRALAHAGRVVDLHLAAVEAERNRDRIARDAGLGACNETLLAEKRVDEGRFADVRAPDDGDLERPLRPLLFARLGGLALQSLDLLIGLDEEMRERRRLAHLFAQGVREIGKAERVLRRELQRLAETERIGLEGARIRHHAFALVG